MKIFCRLRVPRGYRAVFQLNPDGTLEVRLEPI